MSVDLAVKTQKLHALLKGTNAEERQKIIAAVLTLFGDSPLPTGGSPTAGGSGGAGAAGGAANPNPAGGAAGAMTARQYFEAKDPKNKIEELVVAASYHEQYENGTGTPREDFERLFAAAKRTFNASKYTRDLGNAKTKKYFNTGTENVLSHFGEKYVAALPDRKAAKAVPRPGKVVKKKAKKAKA